MAINFEEFEGLVITQFDWLRNEFGYKYLGCICHSTSYFTGYYSNNRLVVQVEVDDWESKTGATIIQAAGLNQLDELEGYWFAQDQSISVRLFCTLINRKYGFPKVYNAYQLAYLVDLSVDMYTYCRHIVDGNMWINNSIASELLQLSASIDHSEEI